MPLTVRNYLLVTFIAGAVCGFLVGFLYLGHSADEGDMHAQTLSVAPKQTFELNVVGRKIVSGPTTLSVPQGTVVTIAITVDEDEELHVHGYDKALDLSKGIRGMLTFEADASGRFPFELEHSKTDLGALEVQPK